MSPVSLKFVFGFVLGVLSTLGFVVGVLFTLAYFPGQDPFKTGSAAVLAASVSSLGSVIIIAFIIINLGVLNVVLLLPRLRSVVSKVKKVIIRCCTRFKRAPSSKRPHAADKHVLVFEQPSDAFILSTGLVILLVFHYELQLLIAASLARRQSKPHASATPGIVPATDAHNTLSLVAFGHPVRRSSDASKARVAITLLQVFRAQLLRLAATSSPTALAMLKTAQNSVGKDAPVAQNMPVVGDAVEGYSKTSVQVVPGLYGQDCDFLPVKYLICLAAIHSTCHCALLFITTRPITWLALSLGYVVAMFMRARDDGTVSGDCSMASDDADTTLVVDESEPQSQGNEHKDNKDAFSIGSPVSRPSLLRLSVSQSAPVAASSAGDHSDLRHSTSSCQLSARIAPFVPSSASASASVRPKPVSVAFEPSVSKPPAQPVLNPAVLAFVPTARIAAAQDAMTMDTAKKDWQPVRPPSFQWARGGCATRITAPPVPAPLNLAAAPFIPMAPVAAPVAPIVDEDAGRAGLSASMWAPTPVAAMCEVPVAAPVPVKWPLVLRSAAPAFWSPGGCAIRIVAPSK
ncbi:hypothetical protein DFH09DRAFT_1357273 [Mycena vulgaris]|nr:hypothetical protein DFH09DRAFT_1357273 [Mycena vulgaris]